MGFILFVFYKLNSMRKAGARGGRGTTLGTIISFILLKKGELNGLCSCEKAGKLLREWLPPCIYSVVEV